MSEISKHTSVDKNQIKKAINALLKYHNTNEQNDLLGNDTNIHLQFGLGQAISKHTAKPNMKPKRIPIPHSLYEDEQSPEEARICIFVKDEKSKKFLQEIQQTEELSSKSKHLKHIKKIIQLPKLRSNYENYKQRLELVNSYDIFLVDDRILPMVGECLGKTFYKKKKQPVPIRLSWEIPVFIHQVLNSTFMTMGFGSCISIRAGRTNMPSDHIVDNCASIITNSVEKHIPNQWANIQTIHVKLTNSIALPIYKATLDLVSHDVEKDLVKEEDKKNPLLKSLNQVKDGSSKRKKEDTSRKSQGDVQKKRKKKLKN